MVDYTTVFNPDWQRWLTYMPEVWLFYCGYPLLFTLLIYKAGWRGWRLSLAVLLSGLLLEVIIFDNPLFDPFPFNLLMFPLTFAIYAFIIFVPLWIVEGHMRRHKGWIITLTLVWFLVALLTYFSPDKSI